MKLIIGGSPSTGSSLLVRMLDRHSELYIGPETKLFTKPGLYDNWDIQKDFIIRNRSGKLACRSWFPNGKLDLINEQYSLSRIKRLAESSSSFPEFSDAYFKTILEQSNKRYWGEKTPSNVGCFKEFNRAFPEARTIFCVRNPYDNIASLIKRGFSIIDAVLVYLWNNALFLTTSDLDIKIVRYEDLVSNPREVMIDLCGYLAIPFEDTMLHTESMGVFMNGWKHDETGKVSTTSVGRYHELSEPEKQRIAYYVSRLVVQMVPEAETTIGDICSRFDYAQIKMHDNFLKNLYFDLMIHRLKRMFKGYKFWGVDFPFRITKH